MSVHISEISIPAALFHTRNGPYEHAVCVSFGLQKDRAPSSQTPEENPSYRNMQDLQQMQMLTGRDWTNDKPIPVLLTKDL